MSYAIKVENLGKRYLIGHQKKEPYSTLRDTLANGVHNLWNRLRNPSLSGSNDEIEEFWALKDINFEIQPGDRVGIIGRNGAGKSTLLKILSRITEPTTGKFTTRGRVASLLEVGTGFHPELTGRDNIFLNGAILGMSRADVKRQFDAIVDFSGVEKFLDTPVKRYSSGMYVRLAFAVAAHLEPDILIVDEVLAVGDAEFQKRCLGKMEEVGKEGRTVVFVSHNMGAVRRLCDRGMVISSGNSMEIARVDIAIKTYQTLCDNAGASLNTGNIEHLQRKHGLGQLAKITLVHILNSRLESTDKLLFGEPFHISFQFYSQSADLDLDMMITIKTMSDDLIATSTSMDNEFLYSIKTSSKGLFSPEKLFLHPGKYVIHIGIRNIDDIENAISFEVLDTPYYDGFSHSGVWGHLTMHGNWSSADRSQKGIQ